MAMLDEVWQIVVAQKKWQIVVAQNNFSLHLVMSRKKRSKNGTTALHNVKLPVHD